MSRPPMKLGPLEPAVTSYARHPIVCAPTAVGNVVGGIPGYAVALVLGFVTWPVLAVIPDETADATFRAYAYTLPYLVGGVTGAPFWPLAQLLEPRPCVFESLQD